MSPSESVILGVSQDMDTDLLGAHPALIRTGIFRGVSMAALAQRLWKLGAMRSEGRCPAIRWRACNRRSLRGTSGRAFTGRGRIVVSVGMRSSRENVAEVLLHELVHMACPESENHGELFCRRLIATAREAFGLDLDTAALLALPARQGRRAYAIDSAITTAMEAAGVGARLLTDVAAPPPPPVPVVTEEQAATRAAAAAAARNEGIAKAAAAREAKARAMLVRWERKAAAARKLAAKWRAKVRYYDRRQQAASKGDKS